MSTIPVVRGHASRTAMAYGIWTVNYIFPSKLFLTHYIKMEVYIT